VASIEQPIANEGNSVSYPPPPQGGYPQQPYPQQPQQPYPPQPYPPQGGYAYPPQQAPQAQPYPPQQQQQQQWGAPAPGPIPPAPPRGGDDDSIKKNLLKIAALLVIVGIIWAGASLLSKDDAKNAAVGNCMKNTGTTGSPELDIVDCSSSDAQYKVVSVHKNTTSTSVCEDGNIGYYESSGRKRNRTRVVLCLSELAN